ncbi:MAG: VIT domain-containing protein [Chthoniobacteraceae bacterium]
MNRAQPTPAFGLVAWLESTRVALPLKGVECRFDITAGVASVEIDQIFHQDNTRPLDCTYTFPLPAGAAVYRCEMHVNGRIIRARVEERSAAARIYREQKARGRRAALVETERENLFTLTLGNVQPGDLIVIRFAYFQTLDRIADELSLRVPVCPGIRYIPGQPLLRANRGRGAIDDTDEVPDASRITPPRIDALHPDAAYFTVTGNIAADEAEAGTLSSPSHAVFVRGADVTLADGAAVPDRDFVLRWREPQAVALEPRAWSSGWRGNTYALAQLRAPADAPIVADDGQDVYFLVDRSGSMAGAKWAQTCVALRSFVEQLGAGDRVWITLFESSFRDFAEKPMPAPAVLADAGFRGLERLGTAGGTALRPAAEHVLKIIARESGERRAAVVLITDGQVGNESAIVASFRRAKGVRAFAFGIDTAVNDAFLRDLARQTGGECWLQTPDDDIAGTVAKLGARLRRPVLTRLALAKGWATPEGRLRDLHAGDALVLSLISIGAAPDELVISGCTNDGKERRLALPLQRAKGPGVRLLWAREQIAAHLAAGQDRVALDLAKEHNLLCEGASFIAWDEAEEVAVASEELYQPSMFADIGMMACMSVDRPTFAPINEITDAMIRCAPPSRLAMREDHSARAGWRLQLGLLGAPLDFIAALGIWQRDSARDESKRVRLLEEFVTRLEADRPSGAEFVRRCREFVEQHFAKRSKLRREALTALDAWAAASP